MSKELLQGCNGKKRQKDKVTPKVSKNTGASMGKIGI
jgi:hypothetical protein